MGSQTFSFKATLWEWSSRQTWVFLTVPDEYSDHFQVASLFQARGWGSVRVEVRMQDMCWKTSVFPQKERQSFILPVKAAVRRKLALRVGDCVAVELRLLDDF